LRGQDELQPELKDTIEDPGDWRVSTAVLMEPGQLDEATARVRALLSSDNNPARHAR
jgi:hypothetical protein